jgi:PAS domain S-box-containing protein
MNGPAGSTTAADVVRRAFDALNRADLGALRALMAADVIEDVVPDGVQDGPEAVLAAYRAVLTALPGLRADAVHLLAHDDLVLVNWEVSGIFSGSAFRGIEPTGSRIRLEGASTLIVRDGLVASVRVLFDAAACARQVGLLPPLGSPEDEASIAALNARTRRQREGGWLTVDELYDLLRAEDLAVIATDVQGMVTEWNAAARRLYGWTREEVVGRPITELTVGPEDSDVAEAIMATVRSTGRWEGEFWVHRRDGTRFLAHVREVILADDAGVSLGLVGVSVAADVDRRRFSQD